ncbi:MAG: hypothetical protein ABFD10_08790 [Prolixibacteraceae bacterium]
MQKIRLPAILIVVFYSVQLSAQPAKKKYVQLLQDVFQTELVYPQEKTEFQFTMFPVYYQHFGYEQYQLPFIAEYGITGKWQLELEWNTFQYKKLHPGNSVSGTGDLEIGTKYSFMNIGNSDFHAAAGFEMGIPLGNGDKKLGEGLWEYEPYLLMAVDFPKLNNAQLFGQTGISFVQQKEIDEPEGNELNMGGGFFIPCRSFIFSSELTWYHSKEANQLFYTPGAVLTMKKGWETGLAFPLGLNKQTLNFGIMAMITFEFNMEGDHD